ncbi:MAG TPA: DUF11 domain-containing protein [Eudoraea sp.]|nr:DUF11 domain-containing protein [Eudoraea sp.]
MRTITIIVFLLSMPVLMISQDLQLNVHVLPTSVIGDPAIFNITVRNTEKDSAQNVVVKIALHSGLEFKSITPKNLDFDPETGTWHVGTVDYYRAQVLGVIATIKSKEDAILSAEVWSSSSRDPDSTPGNGVDTNGNGIIVHDKGDEDDGDAAQNGPFN